MVCQHLTAILSHCPAQCPTGKGRAAGPPRLRSAQSMAPNQTPPARCAWLAAGNLDLMGSATFWWTCESTRIQNDLFSRFSSVS